MNPTMSISFVIIFFISLVMTILKINIFTIFAFNLMLGFLVLILPSLYTAFWETDINKIEKLLIKKKKIPIYQLNYALANKLDEEVKEVIDKLLKKNKARHKQALFKVTYSLYNKDTLAAKQEVDHIKPIDFMYYYKSAILMEEGNLNEAKQFTEKVSKPWMKSALLSELENKSNNPDKAIYFAKQALDNTKGMQKYMFYKTYQREFPQRNSWAN